MIRFIFLFSLTFISYNFLNAKTAHTSQQNNAVNIAIIDYDKIRKESVLGKSINEQAKQMMSNFNKTMSELEANLKKEQAAANPKKPATREEYSESMHKFEEKQDNFVRLSRKLRSVSRNALQTAEYEFKRILKEKIIQYLHATKKNVIVFEKSNVIVATNVLDITDEVLNLLNNSSETIIIQPEVKDVGF